jgi:hypothetical protein
MLHNLLLLLFVLGTLARSSSELFWELWILQTVNRTPWTGDQPSHKAAIYKQENTYTEETPTDIHASNRIRTQVFEQAKTVHDLDRSATVIGGFIISNNVKISQRARGSVVDWGTMLQARRSRYRVSMRWTFSIYLSFQPHYGPGVDSASNRNEYQESSWGGGGVKGGRRIRMATLPPSVSRLSKESVGASTSHNSMDLHGLLTGIALPLLYEPGNFIYWARNPLICSNFSVSNLLHCILASR